MVRLVLLAIMLCNPFAAAWHGIKRATTNSFYAVTNFYVDHIQRNQKGEPGKVENGKDYTSYAIHAVAVPK